MQHCLTLSDKDRDYLGMMAAKLNLSGRGLSRVLKVARTIADLAGEEEIGKKHLAEAMMYRNRDKRG